MLTELVVLIEGLELDLSFEFSETFLSLNHMSPPRPQPSNNGTGQIKHIFFFFPFLLPVFDWMFSLLPETICFSLLAFL